jgi:hypothetical protein
LDELEWDSMQQGQKAQTWIRWDGLMVQVNHRENASWPGPHVHQALAIRLASLNLNVYPPLFLLILAHGTHCEQAELRPFRLLDSQDLKRP